MLDDTVGWTSIPFAWDEEWVDENVGGVCLERN